MRKLSLVCLPLFFLLLVVSREFVVTLFTVRFEAAIPIFALCLVTLPLTALSLDYVPRAFADNGFLVRISALRAGVTFGMLLVLTGRFGLVGAALATVLGLAASRLYAVGRVARLTGRRVRQIAPWGVLARVAACSAVAAGATLPVRALGLPALPTLVLATTTFTVACVALVSACGLLTEEEQEFAARYLRRLRGLGARVTAGRSYPAP
jgi:O-antigen/teichoic acid export membrane protein